MDKAERDQMVRALRVGAVSVAVLWAIHFLLMVLPVSRGALGIVPGKWMGLLGVLTSPLVHADVEHLLLNTTTLLLFMVGAYVIYPRVATRSLIGIWVLGGVWVWILARPVPVIGSSGIVYGLGGFLFFSGVFRRDLRSMVVSLALALAYSGMIEGIFPTREGISWEAHLFGLLAGAVMAWHFRKVDRVPRKRYSWQNEPEQEPQDAQALWNYRENWAGAETVYTPGTEEEQQQP